MAKHWTLSDNSLEMLGKGMRRGRERERRERKTKERTKPKEGQNSWELAQRKSQNSTILFLGQQVSSPPLSLGLTSVKKNIKGEYQ